MSYSGSQSAIPEEIIDDPAVSTALGYSRSKWVAEQICAKAAGQTPLRGFIAVFRVGQLAGDSARGIWNTKEAWPMMLSSVKLTQTLPALTEETLDWLPVDIAANALTQGVNAIDGSGAGVNVLHVLNENRVPKWADLLMWLNKVKTFDTVSPSEWVSRLEQVQETDGANHPAFKLLDLWKRAYAPDRVLEDTEEERGKPFALVKTKKVVPAMRDVQPVDEAYFLKVWQWIDAEM